MKLYAGSSQQFIEDTARNQISEKLRVAFEAHFHFRPGEGEERSWRESLKCMALILTQGRLFDQGVLLEYQLPLTSRRLDFMVTGADSSGGHNARIVELKQWNEAEESDVENCVVTWVGGKFREVLHPSVQVYDYQRFLQDGHSAFHSPDDGLPAIGVNSCAYLHNYPRENPHGVFSDRYRGAMALAPLFGRDDTDGLVDFLKSGTECGNGLEVLKRVERSKYRASKKLLQHVGEVIAAKPQYVLLDEQRVVFEKVLNEAKRMRTSGKKSVIVVKGGPGTGKSVVAMNLLGELSKLGHNTQYATGSKAFTETLRKILGRTASQQLKYFNSYPKADLDAVDIIVCDEAHRIRATSNNMYTKKEARSDKAQIDELLHAARVGVYFIDDQQAVRPNEVGSVALIQAAAKAAGFSYSEYELEAQFRCAGSDGFINWVNNTLGIRDTANVLYDEAQDGFEFKIFDSPTSLDEAIRSRAAEGYSARMTAGFCWDWSKNPLPGGHLKHDIQLGDFSRPWNAHHDATQLARGIPKASLWAHDPGGLDQVGCIYTAQGFEFDYVGVIFGLDLRFDLDRQQWLGDQTKSYDSVVKRSKDRFVDLVKNTYRVLLSRGMKGCYVHFLDKDTERFFRTRIRSANRPS